MARETHLLRGERGQQERDLSNDEDGWLLLIAALVEGEREITRLTPLQAEETNDR